jgi:hypothetical protein
MAERGVVRVERDRGQLRHTAAMRRRIGLALAMAASVLALGGVALAQGPKKAVDDARGDAPAGGLDVVRVALARGSDGRLRAELTMGAAWDAAALRGAATGAPASACLRLYTKADPESDPPDFLVCATPADDGDSYNGLVLRERLDGPPKRVAGAAVTRPTSRTVYVRFGQSTVGRPASIRFAGEVTVPGEGCPVPLGCRDVGPDAPKTARLVLQRTGSSR